MVTERGTFVLVAAPRSARQIVALINRWIRAISEGAAMLSLRKRPKLPALLTARVQSLERGVMPELVTPSTVPCIAVRIGENLITRRIPGRQGSILSP
ncbi:MAG: hypothetical protein C1943_15710 [Halochromatium sp.]|nr:hypothetical protein [Halochromatium sp.]